MIARHTINNQSIKVMHFILRLECGGAESVVSSLVNYASLNGIIPSICCLKNEGGLALNLRKKGVPVYAFHHFKGISWSLPFRLKKILIEEDIDILHVHSYSLMFYAAQTKGLWRKRLPIVLTAHGEYGGTRTIAKCIDFFILRAASKIIAVSETNKKSLIRKFCLSPNKVAIVLNGVPLPDFDVATARARIRREAGLSDEDYVIICVASFQPLKDHLTLLRAMKIILQRIPNAYLLLLGRGDLEQETKRVTRDLHIGQHIKFLGLRRNVMEWLAASDLFVLTSRTEGTSMAILEAMACGRPVLATRAGGNSKLVENGVNGFLVEPHNPEVVSDRAVQVLSMPDRGASFGYVGSQKVKTSFSIETMVSSYADVYKNLINIKRKNA